MGIYSKQCAIINESILSNKRRTVSSLVLIRLDSEEIKRHIHAIFQIHSHFPFQWKTVYFLHSFTRILLWVLLHLHQFVLQKGSKEDPHLLLQVSGPWPQHPAPPDPGGLAVLGQCQLWHGAAGWPCSRLLWKEPWERPLEVFPAITPNLHSSSSPHLWSLP